MPIVNPIVQPIVSPIVEAILGGAFLPSNLPNLEAWYRFNQGITVTGAGVSQWDDQSGNGNHLLQGTDTNRPSKEADGSILFDGVDNYLRAIFTLSQPETIYILGRQVTWTNGDTIFDGSGGVNTMRLHQFSASPNLRQVSALAGAQNTDLAIDTYATISCVFNGVNGLIQINNNTPTTGNSGVGGGESGIILGAEPTPGGYSNVQVKEVIVYSAAHDAATRAQVIAYLNSI